jgi:branched-chain amino acid transport system ATP-binding protein
VAESSGAPLLECSQLVTGFGATQVLHGIDLTIRPGELCGVFGLNGAGKSVTMKTISGLVPLWSGSVRFDGVDITKLSPAKRVALGIGNVPQGRQVFKDLTVEENLRLGARTSRRADKSAYAGRLERIYEQFPVLAKKRTDLGGSLSGGEQASLAVGRALINAPKLLLVDEPSAGLAPSIIGALFDVLRQATEGGVVLLIEQNVAFGLRLVDTANLLQAGRVVHSGPTSSLDPNLLAERLGIGRMLGGGATEAVRAQRRAARRTPDGRRQPIRVR